jgi:CBS domain-containing protein
MKARDIMSTQVVTVGEESTVHEMAALMIEKHISGLPVVAADGRLLGMVSEGDLMRRPEIGTDKHRTRWLSFFTGANEQAREFTKSHALHARDIMSRPVIHVAGDAPLEQIVQLMEKHAIKRLPVTKDGKLVGLVTRADVLRVLATNVATAIPAPPASDAAIRDAMNKVLAEEDWARSAMVNVIVDEGLVHLWGVIDTEDQRRALHVAAESISGVKGVEDHLTFSLPT